jgi:ATP-dependent DNA ligase
MMTAFLYAFDLIELNGDDLRRDPLEVRKATLASIVAKARSGIRFNEHMEGDGPTVFAHACKLGLEGIVSKKDSGYRSGRSAFEALYCASAAAYVFASCLLWVILWALLR